MKLFDGHIVMGPVCIYGRNAMHWAVNIKTKRWGYVCFRLPLWAFGVWWPLYFYASPNATPWASTFYIGDRRESVLALVRRKTFGHNFDVEKDYDKLSAINGYA